MMKKVIFAAATVAVAASLPAHANEMNKDHDGHKGYFAKMDTNSDGAVTRAEFDAFSVKKFNKSDANGDGKVTAEEFKAVKMKHKKMRKDGKDLVKKENVKDMKPESK